MAITNVAKYAHLSQVDLEAFEPIWMKFARTSNARLARRIALTSTTIAFRRGLDMAARLVIGLTKSSPGSGVGNDGARHCEEHREHSSPATSATAGADVMVAVVVGVAPLRRRTHQWAVRPCCPAVDQLAVITRAGSTVSFHREGML